MTEEKLKAALIQAHNKGDKEAANLFARKIKELRSSNNVIPVGTGENAQLVDMNQQPAQQPELTMGDQFLGALETGAALATGATTGALGYLGGAAQGLTRQALGGYTADEARAMAEQGAQNLTYAPRTAAGQEQTAALGEALSFLPPVVAGFSPQQFTGAGQAAKASVQAARGVPEMIPQRQPQSMGGLSVGAAEVPPEQVRMQQAQDLPVPLPLTKGMASQDFAQQRFERETAKDPELGAPIRERMTLLNQGINQNIDEFISATGTNLPETAWRLETGNKVIKALESGLASERKKVSNAYNVARAKGELEAVIPDETINTVSAFVNENRAKRSAAPVLKGFVDEAIVKEFGSGSIEDGSFKLKPLSISQAEELRQEVNRIVDKKNGQDLFFSGQIKKLIDNAQDTVGGQTFKSARKMNQQLANKYKNLAIIDQLLDTKGQYNDQKIAAENVVSKAVINGSVDDLKNLRRVLSTAGKDGLDALTEVRAAAVRHIRDEATKNVGRDPSGNPLVSASGMDRAIKALDKNGKLDLLFGKKEADKLRLLNDVTKDIMVAQPNAVNNSNTASVVLAAFDLMNTAATGVPIPVLSGLKATRDRIAKSKTEKKVKEALK